MGSVGQPMPLPKDVAWHGQAVSEPPPQRTFESAYREMFPRITELKQAAGVQLLYEGPVVVLGFKVKRLKQRYLFLFTGFLVITKPLGRHKHRPRWVIALNSRKAVHAVPDSQYFIRNVEFRLYTPRRTFTFFGRDTADRDRWIKHLEDQTRERS